MSHQIQHQILHQTLLHRIQTLIQHGNNQTSGSSSKNKSNINIEILNASGSNQKLEKATKLLKNAGYNITKTGETSTVATTIITNKKGIDSEEIKNIEETLGVGYISNNRSSTSKVDVQIILGRDFTN